MLTTALVAAGIQLSPLSLTTAEPAAAADLSQFDPGRIIDDSIFFNGNAMTARQVQDFLQTKVAACTPGYTCLKDFRQNTTSKPADAMCNGYTATAYESAADIIAKVGQTCGISQKVLLVTLQKEQGLVTHTWPSEWRYTIAMGQGCPDTAACDTAFYGFFNQVYGAARQLKRYANPPGTSNFFTWYAPGKTWNILYNPNAQCGSAPVYVRNQATADLYYYTPYQPNRAALNSGYGSGDACSAYGNRNFYNYFTDWFGSTRGFDVGGVFTDYFAANGAWLGYTTGPVACNAAGCSQSFSGGMAFSSSGGVHGVRQDYVAAWGNYGRETGQLGYPTSEKLCSDMNNACRQEFQGGWLVSNSSIGVRMLASAVVASWSNWGRDYGAIGLPISDAGCEPGGVCLQAFQNAWIVSSADVGARVVPNAVFSTWSNWGRQYGTLGLPIADPSVPGGSNYVQAFQGGLITVTSNTGAVTSTSDPWFNAVVTSSWLGSPSGSKLCTLGAGGCYQVFSGGWLVQSSAGSFAVPAVVRDAWLSWGRNLGILGFPNGAPSADPRTGAYSQSFQGGVLTVSGGNATLTSTTDPWFSAVISSPWLGASSTPRTCTLGSGGCYQPYAGGWVVRSDSGAFAVPTAVLSTWFNWGRELGILGYPTGPVSGNPGTGNYTQSFRGGVISVVNGVGSLTSTTDPWFSTTMTNSWLAASSGTRSCGLSDGGCYQAFQGGWVVQSTQGAFAMPNAVRDVWLNWGRDVGILGYPTSGPSANPATGNYTQSFRGGLVTVSGGIARVSSTTDRWFSTVLASPWLGSATAPRTCSLKGGRCSQPFQGGWVVDAPTGAYAVPSAVLSTWFNWGREYGDAGFPTGAPSADPTTGNYSQTFEGGPITVTSGIGRFR